MAAWSVCAFCFRETNQEYILPDRELPNSNVSLPARVIILRIRDLVGVADSFAARYFWGTLVKRILISAATAVAFATAGHADELSDIQAQSKELREQNQALTKRIADLERRQRKLEAQPAKQPAATARSSNPADSMAADFAYKAEHKKAPVDDS